MCQISLHAGLFGTLAFLILLFLMVEKFNVYQLHEILEKPYLVPKLTVDRATFEPTTLDTKQT